VLVEGHSDVAAVHAVARRRGHDLVFDGIDVIAVGGYGGFAAAFAGLDPEDVSVLCDAGRRAPSLASYPQLRCSCATPTSKTS
jgi:hypothetical protein